MIIPKFAGTLPDFSGFCRIFRKDIQLHRKPIYINPIKQADSEKYLFVINDKTNDTKFCRDFAGIFGKTPRGEYVLFTPG
jgi:hypothetical protein